MSTFYKLSIKEIKRETPSAISVTFNIPLEFQDFYKFTAGQYVTLKLTLDGEEIRRAYSICSSPNSGELRISIKAIKNGFFSKFANEQLTAGKVIEVGVPEGKFTFEPNAERQKNYAGFAAGSGITPIMSILKSVLESEPKSTFVLTYGNKSPEETIFHDELHDLQQKYVGRLFVHYVFSQSGKGELFGRIDKSAVNFVLHTKHNEKTFEKFYLCGPEEMINIVSSTLKEQNIKEGDIKFELFSTSTENDKEISAQGHTKITILLDDEETSFEMSQKQTLLEAALKQSLDAPYSCQGGICSSCIARVTEGKAEMKKNQILTDDEIEEGLVLTCQAHPITPTIKVDYDDV
ncbi:2Fe-2S iron-sulfur cluster-binding protein [Flavobacterium okayamense]|uniref:Flavodoxin reductase n=1 Tax=Flavobacterium okayamense TaxID=2830782 RepID=A0ABM7S2K9_9FLAO|nr:2Fe-2S iron-sulfur cluster-binding protein [Flavobacterium okayamense]BCY27854.1 flavodoxin reductase [Flavobacterium okayamense]